MKPAAKKPLPRYTARPLPPYRFVPGESPHPTRDPEGHSFNESRYELKPFQAPEWRNCDAYLYGVDLFNHGYWWEAHEALEDVWLAAGQRETLCGRFVQGLIQLAAAQLKRFMAEPRGAKSLTVAGIEKIAEVEGVYLGVEVAELMAEAERCLREDRGEFPRIELFF